MSDLLNLQIDSEVKRYLFTGDADSFGDNWPGNNFIERARSAHHHLRSTLNEEVRKRTQKLSPIEMPAIEDLQNFARQKIDPMVKGLFPESERESVLKALTSSIVFITPISIYEIIQNTRWHKTAWDLANLYLLSLDADLLGKDAPNIVGLSEETTCYISPSYFHEQDRFADFLVHEAAHIFHNCKRATIGLKETRTKEWLLPVAFGLRETFAFSCEAYSRILALGPTPNARKLLLDEHRKTFSRDFDCIEYDIYWRCLEAAVAKRNGWKEILTICKNTNGKSTPRTGAQ